MIIVVLIVLGLAFGSFVNALVWRLHQQATVRSKKAKAAFSITTGRSMCVLCRHPLATKDLIPVVSWLWLRGRCRYCRAPIADTPIPELLTPLLFVLSYIYWPYVWNHEGIFLFALWLVFLVGFVALTLYDLQWYLLPNKIIFPLIAIASLSVFVQITMFGGGVTVLLQSMWGLVFGGGIFWLIFQISDGAWIGGGDVKLGWLLGLILGGPAMSLLMIFVASLVGTVVSLPLLAAGRAKRTSHLPFGPFLLLAAVVVRLFGASAILWYKHKLGLY